MKHLVIPLLLVGCSRAPTNPPSRGQPVLSLSVNGSANVQVAKRWPLLVRGVLSNSERSAGDAAQPLRLHPAHDTWAAAIRFRVTDSTGAEQAWPISLVSPPEQPMLELPSRVWTEVAWQMKPDDTSRIALGSYRMSAELAIEDGLGWNGRTTSTPVTVQIVDTPDLSPDDAAAAEAMLRAQYAAYNRDPSAAAAILDALLSAQPARTKALAARAQLAEAAGDPSLAFLCAAQAVTIARQKNPDAKEPPAELILLRDRLFAALPR